ncbi:MAG: phage recombination protein Bet [Eubacterium coprostanoligenes]|uniref:phage recombination protein Bet n=1 Tax=Eubacterium coprostanoligenes TaxID=290054 RepID=UPI0023F260DA|nr:phage recombination protein Bet [Eubacterium coprostanoligenes]MDD7358654.1 phage recombination protein Bet [Eubacterium coprostanoligenes]
MSNTETKEEKKELTVTFEVDGEKVKLSPAIVQNYIVGKDKGKITVPEFKFFTSLCKARKLNPFLREAYLVKYGDTQPAQMVVSKDVIMRRAVLHPDYDGIEDGIIVTNENGEIIERKGCFKLPNETLVGAWAKVYRKSWKYPTYCSVSFDEVAQKKKDGSLNSMWADKGATMANKVAKCRALRESFVEEFSQIYDETEMGVDLSSETQNQEIVQQDEPIEVDATPVENVVNMDEI